MSMEIYNTYSKHLLTKEEFESIENKHEYVRTHGAGVQKSKYVKIKTFNKLLSEIIRTKRERKTFSTDSDFVICMNDAYNVLYIDIDYLIYDTTLEEAEEFNDAFSKGIVSVIKRDANYLAFKPSKLVTDETKVVKCGAHVFMFFQEPFDSRKDRIRYIDELKTKIEKKLSPLYEDLRDKIYDSGKSKLPLWGMVDAPRLASTTSIILPFAQKSSSSRSYSLFASSKHLDKLVVGLSETQFKALGSKQGSNFANLTLDCDSDDWDVMRKKTSSECRQIFRQRCVKIHETYEGSEYSSMLGIEMYLYDFIDGLSCLCQDHPLVSDFSRGTFSEDQSFTFNLIEFYYSLYVLVNDSIPDGLIEYLNEFILGILDPLYVRGGKTKREDRMSNVKYCITKLSENKYFLRIGHEEVRDFKSFIKLSPKEKSGRENSADETIKNAYVALKRNHARTKKFIESGIRQWCTYIEKNVMQNMTFEIEPFNRANKNRDIEKLSYRQLRSDQASSSEYKIQLMNLNKMFIFIGAWQHSLECVDPVVERIIKTYISNYIYAVKDSNSLGGADSIYIYNIQQTKSLERLPYNQWILDRDDYLGEWLSCLYLEIIEPLSREDRYNSEGGINNILSVVADEYKIIEKTQYTKSAIRCLKLPTNGSAYLEGLKRNIVRFYRGINNVNPTILLPHLSDYLSVRNGIIRYEFKNGQWGINFTTRNQDIILGTYSLAKYDPKYDFENVHVNELLKVVDSIYPDEGERDYILNMFSSTICPLITKDQILFVYGSGSDGKSTMNRILGTMLGNNSRETPCMENGEQIILRNPCGYGSSFCSNVLMQSKQRGAHDEGGVINFNNKTFSVTQEPPQGKIKTEVIKDFTSMGISNARKIQQANTEFIVNALIVVETNLLPSYDVIDDAVRRRVAVYPHRTKFTTEANEGRYKYQPHRSKAQPEIINNMLKVTEYWQALLHILIKHALKLLNDEKSGGIRTLSNIPVPTRVKDFTSSTFGRSSGLSGWLTKYVTESDTGMLSLSGLVDTVLTYNNKNKKRTGGILERSYGNAKEQEDEIYKTIQDTFSGSLFVLKKELIRSKRFATRFVVDDSKIDEILADCDNMKIDEIRGKYTQDGYSISTIEDGNDSDHRDIVILGYMIDEESLGDSFGEMVIA